MRDGLLLQQAACECAARHSVQTPTARVRPQSCRTPSQRPGGISWRALDHFNTGRAWPFRTGVELLAAAAVQQGLVRAPSVSG